MPRFVLLRHEFPAGSAREPHFDWMFENSGRLLTWVLDEPPLAPEQWGSCNARRLADHRIEYLQFEGPISDGRGHVSMLIEGTFEWFSKTESSWIASLSVRGRNETWHVTFQPAVEIDFVVNSSTRISWNLASKSN